MTISALLDARLKVSRELLYQRVRDETVILDLAGEQYYSLNAVGSYIWDLLGEDHTLAQIAQVIAREFDAPLAQAQDDLRVFVEQLVAAGLAEVEPSCAAGPD